MLRAGRLIPSSRPAPLRAGRCRFPCGTLINRVTDMRCLPVLLALVLGSAGRAAADTSPVVRGPIAARIDTFMTRVAESGLSGSLLVERDGQVILHRGYGTVDRASGRRATPDTPYHIGSLGKQFTAAAILKLESAGRLHTRDSLPQWFANVPADKQR